MFNISIRKVGGLTWLRIGRLTLAFNVAPAYRPLGSGERKAKAKRYTERQLIKAYNQGLASGQFWGLRGVRVEG